MRRDLLAAARFLVVPTLAVAGFAIFAPGRAELALRIYALVVSATAIAVLVVALRRAYPEETPLLEAAPTAPTRAAPPSLRRIEHAMALGVASSFDLHFRLAPRLRAVAAGLLQARRGSSLSDDAARDVLGDEGWGLVRPDRPAPGNRLAKGAEPAELERVVHALEAV